MKKVLPLLSLLALLACTKADEPTARNNGLIGKWRLVESLNDPGDGSGTFQGVKVKDAETIEFRADSTFRVVTEGRSGFFPGVSSTPRFTVRANRFYLLFTAQPETQFWEKIQFKAQPERLQLIFPCIEPCAGKYIAVK